MNAKCGECSADLEPVVRVQGGTFGYIEKHSDSTGNQRSPLLMLMLPTLPLRCTGESLTFKFSITSLLMTRSAEEFEKVTEDTSSNRERNHVAE